MLEPDQLKDLIRFRQEVHRTPELSGKEDKTARRVLSFLKSLNPDTILENLGGTGLLAIFNGQEAGKFLVFRCELDALPIQEKNTLDYLSENPGVAHLCGHDGHMAIALGLAQKVSAGLKKGKVGILFQPAEENGKGAEAILKDERFKSLNIDKIIGLHNLPGFPMHQVVSRARSFNACSIGMKVQLMGETSHAAEPEKGVNPGKALAAMTSGIHALSLDNYDSVDLKIITPIFVRMGEEAFGTSAGEASFGFTLRAYKQKILDVLMEEAEGVYREELLKCPGLKGNLDWIEYFSPIVNSAEDHKALEQISSKLNLEYEEKDLPFRWCEDFGLYSNQAPIFFFGLGSGVNQPALHNHDYDFPDELIETGVRIFYQMVLDWSDA